MVLVDFNNYTKSIVLFYFILCLVIILIYEAQLFTEFVLFLSFVKYFRILRVQCPLTIRQGRKFLKIVCFCKTLFFSAEKC